MILTLLAFVIGCIGIVRAVQVGPDDVTLHYMGVTAAVVALRRVDELSFGSFRMKLRAMEEKVDKLQVISTPTQGYANQTAAAGALDPLENKFGGKPAANGRELSAVVRPSQRPGLYWIDLTVKPQPLQRPLSKNVQFHLHPTFAANKPVIAVDKDGVCRYSLLAYGAFVVGAVTDDGETKLELNLKDAPGADEVFRSR